MCLPACVLLCPHQQPLSLPSQVPEDYASINAAVAACAAGGKVLVRAAVYNETVFIDHEVTLEGIPEPWSAQTNMQLPFMTRKQVLALCVSFGPFRSGVHKDFFDRLLLLLAESLGEYHDVDWPLEHRVFPVIRWTKKPAAVR